MAVCSVFTIAVLLKKIETEKEASYQSNVKNLSGTVTYLERISLPENSTVEITLEDASSSVEMSKVTIVSQGENVPLPFTFTYNQQEIDESHIYTISAKITIDGKIHWITPEGVPVLTNNAPLDAVEIQVHQVGSSLASQGNVILNGSTFRLVEFNGKEIDNTEKYLLSFSDNTLQAKFCNSMGGEYTLENQIIQGILTSTEMMCMEPEHLMGIEDTFIKIISSGAILEQNAHILTLSTDDSHMTFQVFMD